MPSWPRGPCRSGSNIDGADRVLDQASLAYTVARFKVALVATAASTYEAGARRCSVTGPAYQVLTSSLVRRAARAPRSRGSRVIEEEARLDERLAKFSASGVSRSAPTVWRLERVSGAARRPRRRCAT